MTLSTAGLAPAIGHILASVSVADGGLRCTVGDEELDAKTPTDLQRKLAVALYETVHAGRERDLSTGRQRSLRDPRRERLLTAAVPHAETTVKAWLHAVPDEETLLVEVDGVRVRAPRAAVGELPAGGSGAVNLRIAACRPALSPGYFLVDSARGRAAGLPLLRVYVHLTDPGSALAAWGAALGCLRDLRVPYRAKVSSADRLFPRRDALVIYLARGAWHAVGDLAAAVGHTPGLGEATSPLVHRVAPGVGVAWEPQDPRPGRRFLSFGEHRTQVIADALLRHAVRTDDDKSLGTRIVEAFLDASIDPLAPARNPSSPRLPDIHLV